MEPSGAREADTPARTYKEPSLERSLSSDLVSLSSSDSEYHSDQGGEPHLHQHSPREGQGTSELSTSTPQSVDSDTPHPHLPLGASPLRNTGDMPTALDTRTRPASDPGLLASPQRVRSEGSEGSSGGGGSPMTGSLRYQLLDKSKLRVTEFESTGLLYARASQPKHNVDLMSPADEVAEEASGEEVEQDKGNIHIQPAQVHRVTDMVVEQPTLETGERWVAPIDPGALLEMEKSAGQVAAEMLHVMDNLRNSLFAMTICTKQSMQLHRESVDNLHTVIDNNVKGMYTFMTKFEELHKSMTPLKQLASQIQEMDDNLKTLERAFAKSKQ